MLIIIIPVLLLVFLMLLALQVFLSMRKNMWLGLILPILYFLLAVFIALSISTNSDAKAFIMGFILLLIPSVINLVTYLVCRAIVKEKNQNVI